MSNITIFSQQVSYDDGGGASDSESGHDVYLERVKAEGQERDSEDGRVAICAVTAGKQCVLVCVVCVEDSDFVAHGSGSDDALELVVVCRGSMLATPTIGTMSLQRTVMKINLLKRNHGAASPTNHLLQVPKEANRYVVKHNKHLATKSFILHLFI